MNNSNLERLVIGGFTAGKNLHLLSVFQPSDFKEYGDVFSAVCESYAAGDLFRSDVKGFVDYAHIGKLCGKTFAEIYQISMISAEEIINHSSFCKAFAEIKLRKAASNVIAKNGSIDEFYREAVALSAAFEKPPELQSIGEWMQIHYIDDLERRAATSSRCSFGLPCLDRGVGNIRAGQLLTIAARPRNGKSALAQSIALANAEAKRKVVYVSLEMDESVISDRFVAKCSGIKPSEAQKFFRGNRKPTQDEDGCIISMAEKKPFERIFVQTGTRSLSKIKALIRTAKPDLLIIDQLSLVGAEINGTTREEFTFKMQFFKNLAADYHIPVVLLAQLNRNADGEIPSLKDLKESGSIEEFSDVVLLIHRFAGWQNAAENDFAGAEEYQKYLTADGEPKYLPCSLHIAKNRNGSEGYYRAVFEGERYTFHDVN